MPTLLIATNNPWKARFFAQILQVYGFKAISLKEAHIETPPVEECGVSVVENALLKARPHHSAHHPWVFADDAGLEIDALDGEPGVQMKRWGGRFPNGISDQTWLEYLLVRMRDVPPPARTAHWIDGWALIDPHGNEHVYESRTDFTIAVAPLRPLSAGAPVLAVAQGLPEDPKEIIQTAQQHWAAWGILEKLRNYH